MKAVIYFSLSKKKRSREVALQIEGDHYELLPADGVPKIFFFQLVKLGFATIRNKKLSVAVPKIDYDQYEEIVLVFPIWAGRMAQYMKSYLMANPFSGKKVTLVASSDSGRRSYRQNLNDVVDSSNEVIDIVMYKGNQLLG